MRAHPHPIGKSSRNSLHSSKSHGGQPSGVAAVAAATEPPSQGHQQQSSSDRARIAVLKSDVNLVQGEIDAFRGDPGGILELQSLLGKYQWTVDPAANAQVRDQLTTILLRKLNELANACQGRLYSGGSAQNNLPLLPQSSLVADVVGFFQLRRIHQPTTSTALRVSSASPSQASTHGAISSLQPVNPATSSFAGAPATSQQVPPMAACDPEETQRAPQEPSRIYDSRVTPAHGPADGSRTPPSPMEGLSDRSDDDGFDDDDDGVSWGQPQLKQRRSRDHPSSRKATPEPQSSVVPADEPHAPLGVVSMDAVSRLTRQLERTKLQLTFFKSLEKHLLTVQNVSENLQLIAATPAVDGLHTSLKKAVEQFYPLGVPAVNAATSAAAAAATAAAATSTSKASAASPKKGAAKVADQPAAANVSAAAALSNVLAGPPDEKKLRIALAYQNSVIESLTNNISQQAREDRDTIQNLKEQLSVLQKRLEAQSSLAARGRVSVNTQLDRVGNALRLQTPSAFGNTTPLSSWLQPPSNVGGLSSRPLSRASVADGGGLLGFPSALTPQPHGQLLALPPRPASSFAVVDIHDQSDALFGSSAHDSHRPPVSASATAGRPSAGRLRPLVATRPEDVDGEAERRYLQVIRTQSEIIKELSQKTGIGRSAASSMSALAGLNLGAPRSSGDAVASANSST